ncbi:nucleic acid-binding, partial [Striga asiatica]
MNKTEWNIKVRVVRCYERTTFVDRSTIWGYRVERTSKVCPKSTYKKEASSIKKFHMELFRRHLKEGSVIAIRDFIVSPNGGRYKITIGRDKIAFHGRTRVLRVSKDRFPKFLYNFTSFSQLAKGTFFDPMLIDVIGLAVGLNKSQTRTFDNRTTRFAEITLEDIEKFLYIYNNKIRNKLSCTLWEEKVDEIMPSILNCDIEPLVVILQFCRAKVVGAPVQVSNTSDITKLIVDQSADEIKDIVAAYGRCAEIASLIREVNALLVITGNVETKNKFEFSVKTIDYLYMWGQVGSYWICVLIESFTEKVDEVMPSILNRDVESLVVILQFCRVKVFGGGCAEIVRSIREVNAPLTINYLYTCGQVGSYWICALIESFAGDYWYQSCRKCPKKLTSAGKRFYCEKCDDFIDDVRMDKNCTDEHRVEKGSFSQLKKAREIVEEFRKPVFEDSHHPIRMDKSCIDEHRVEKGSFSQLRKAREIVEEFWKPIFGDSQNPSAAMKSNFVHSYCYLIPTTIWRYNEVPDCNNISFLQMAPKKLHMKLLDRRSLLF